MELISGNLDVVPSFLNSRAHTVYDPESQEMCPSKVPHVCFLLHHASQIYNVAKIQKSSHLERAKSP